MPCFHCCRQVSEHALARQLQVDFERRHSGTTEYDAHVSSKEYALPRRYLKLTNRVDILTCVRCYELPQIRRKLDDDSRGIASLVGAVRDPMKPRTTAKAD